MALELKQTIRLSQQLVMTPQLQQAIKLLQLSRLELLNTIQQELVENPVLEEVQEEEADTPAGAGEEPGAEAPAERETAPETPSEEPTAAEVVGDVDWENYMESRPHTSLAQGDEDRPSLEENLTPGESLSDHLLWQLGFVGLDEVESEVSALILGNLDDNGYLDESIEAIAQVAETTPDIVEKALHRIQRLDPVGVAARSLAECLRVQMEFVHLNDPLVARIVDQHLALLQRKDYRGIAAAENTEIAEVAAAARVIAGFEPWPGRRFAAEDPIYITPDIFVYKMGDEYHVVLNEDGLPKLRVSGMYRSVLSRDGGAPREAREYVRERLRSAVWLIKSIHQRQRTIVRVMESIIRFQRDFFDKGTEHLRPLNLRDVADDIGMHESTVSRVTTNKYAQTPHGVYALKFFFNSSIRTADGDSIASESVKEKIRELIRGEDPVRPYSDQKLAELLRQRNIQIARRTVTKYREAMRIMASTQRRQIS